MKLMGKRILSMLCAVTIMLSLILVPGMGIQTKAATVDGLDLSTMQIAYPASATSVERTAVSELYNYILNMTGVKLQRVAENKVTGKAIYVGNTNYAQNNGVTYPTEGDTNGEAWAIKAVDGNLVLVGAPQRGVLYAAYHLLEDVLGVRWWNMWEEYVPTGSAIVPADYADSGVPAFAYRETFIGKDDSANYKYFAHNRVNGSSTNITTAYGGEESYDGAHVHTFLRYFSQSEFEANPEWFSLISNKRTWGAQLCLTNSGLKDAYATKLLGRISDNPNAIHNISPDDNEKFCQCSTCQSEINTYGYSGYILRFVNEMAARVKAAGYTDTTIEMLAYWVYEAPPKGGVVPADNVQVRFCGRSADLMNELDDPSNATTLANLKGWQAITTNGVYYWQYIVHYYNNGIAPTMFNYDDEAAILQELGVSGWFTEQENAINTDFWDMKLWLLTKLMEEPVTGDEYAALMDEFIYGYYGEEAGKYIREYLYYMYEKTEAAGISRAFYDNIIGAEWLTAQDIIKGNELFEKAFAAAAGDETLLRRLRCARSGLDRVIVENYAKWKSQATLPFTQREAGNRLSITFAEQTALRGSYDSENLNYRYDNYGSNVTTLPSGVAAMDPGHYHEHNAYDMDTGYMTRVEDSASATGVAMKYENYLLSATLSYVYYVNGSSSAKSSTIGTITSIKRNQGYYVYSFNWTVPSNITNKNPNRDDYISMFSGYFKDWRWGDELMPFAGQTVKVYLSMKVESSVNYIDRIIVVPYSQVSHSYTYQTDSYGLGCRKVCTICGDVQIGTHNHSNAVVTAPTCSSVGYTTYSCTLCGSSYTANEVAMLDHTWDGGVVTKEPSADADGEMTYTCVNCGAKRVETIERVRINENHPHALHNYNYEGFSQEEENVNNIVSDAEAYGGQARIYTNDLDGGLVVYRYDRNNTELTNQKLGGIAKNEVLKNLDKGYQTYSFTFKLPSEGMTSDAPFVYFTGNWELNHGQMAKDFKAQAGQTVTLLLSVKINSTNKTDADGNALYDIYVDQAQLQESCDAYRVALTCTKCGKDFSDSVNPDAHAMHTYIYDQFSGSTVVSDDDAFGGQAKKFTGMNLTGDHKINVYIFDRGIAETDKSKESRPIGSVAANDVKLNQGYQTYTFTFTVPTDLSDDLPFVYFVASWGVNCAQMAKDLKALEGKKVTLLMSMKAEGTTTDATLYFDKMQIVDSASCEDYASANGTYCTVCGKSLLDETLPGELQLLNKKHVIKYDYSDFSVSAGGAIVDDADSAIGKAFSHTLDVSSKVEIYRYAESGADFEHKYLELIVIPAADLSVNNGYWFYNSTVTVPEDIVTPGDYVYVNWHCRNTALRDDLAEFAGKTVEFYVSLKVTGTDLTAAQVYVDQMILVTDCEDCWDEGVITTQPTTESEGVKTYTCTACGETKTEAVEKLPAPAVSWNLTLDGNIGMNFVLNATDEQAANATVAYTVNGKTTEKALNGETTLTVELAAAQMTEKVTLALTTEEGTYTKDYSVADYAAIILAGDYTDATKNLVKYMLAYGAASQEYFDYNTDNLPDVSVEAATVPTEGGSVETEGSVTGVKFYGASLVHENKIAVRFYFSAESLEGLTFSGTVQQKNDLYYVELADICPQDLDADLTVTVTDGTDTLSVAYAPLDYIIRMYAKGGSSAALVQALYGYYLAAEAYTG